MNKITIEKQDLTVETLTIPADQIDAVMAELTERFGKRDGFVEGQRCFLLYGDGDIGAITYDTYIYGKEAERGRVKHTKAEAVAKDERDLAEQRLRKAYLAVTGGAEIEGTYYVPWSHTDVWTGQKCRGVICHPYRFATAEQAAAFGRDNGDDLMRMMSV